MKASPDFSLEVAKPWVAQLRRGVLELCTLASLQRSEAYGYEILQRLSLIPTLAITESTLYPILSRLADDKYLSVRSAASPSGPPRRYYRLTPLGLARLQEMSSDWQQLQNSVSIWLNTQQQPTHDNPEQAEPKHAA